MTAPSTLRFRRILLKLSGEALMGDAKYGIHPPTLSRIASEIGDVVKAGVQVAVVIGGGNIFRGVSASTEGMDPVLPLPHQGLARELEEDAAVPEGSGRGHVRPLLPCARQGQQ